MKKVKLMVGIIFLIVYIGYNYYLYEEMYSEELVPPIITFKDKEIYVSVNDGNDVLLSGVKAMDKQDGDVSSSLIVEEKTRFTSENTRTVSYVAFDHDHNAVRATRKLIYTDYKIPDISLSGPLIFASEATGFTPEEYVQATSVLDGNLTSKVRILNSEDYKQGDNEIELAVNDSAGGERRIHVTCTINPEINKNLLDILLNEYFIEAKVGDKINPKDYIKDVLVRGQSSKDLIKRVTYSDVNLNNSGIFEVNYELSYGENIAHTRLAILVEGGDTGE